MNNKVGSVAKKLGVLLLAFLLVAGSIFLSASPSWADAKNDTKVQVGNYIFDKDYFNASKDCNEGIFAIITSPSDCKIDPTHDEVLKIEVKRKDSIFGVDARKIYKITPHNNQKSYICEEGGAGVNRGYAATFEEIKSDGTADEESVDVCTTVNAAGQDTTHANLDVNEINGGIQIHFYNTGNDKWNNTGNFPRETYEFIDFGLADLEVQLEKDLFAQETNYSVKLDCNGAEDPFLDLDSCFASNGESPQVEITKKSGLGSEDITKIYQVNSNIGDEDYLCSEGGTSDETTTKRGYAATVVEVLFDGTDRIIGDVCTSIDREGDNTARSIFRVREFQESLRSSSVRIEFSNAGNAWTTVGEYPNSLQENVDFSS